MKQFLSFQGMSSGFVKKNPNKMKYPYQAKNKICNTLKKHKLSMAIDSLDVLNFSFFIAGKLLGQKEFAGLKILLQN